MNDPVFRMRAKVAEKAHGHVFEDRFLKLRGIQLVLAYRQAVKDEDADFEVVKALNESWKKRFETYFKALFMYTNPKMYAEFLETKDLEMHRDEVKPEEFPELWEEILESIPNEMTVEEEGIDPMGGLPTVDPHTEEILAGFVPYKQRKDGE